MFLCEYDAPEFAAAEEGDGEEGVVRVGPRGLCARGQVCVTAAARGAALAVRSAPCAR